MSTRLARLLVQLELDAERYTTPLEQLVGRSQRIGNRIGSALGSALRVASAAGILAVSTAILAIGGAAFNLAADTEAATSQIQAQFDLTAERAETLGDVALGVFGNNFFESVGDAAAAVGRVDQAFDNLTDGELKNITELSANVADAFEQDFDDVVSAAQSLVDNGLAGTVNEAVDLIATGFQTGLDRSGDFLDTINEYSTQFGNAGASGAEFLETLAGGLAGGNLGVDKIADAFKELPLRIAGGSDGVREQLSNIGLDLDDINEGLASGALSQADVFDNVIGALLSVDESIANAAIQSGELGTQFEDLTLSGLQGFRDLATGFGDVDGAAAGLNVQYENLGAAAEGFRRRALVALQPLVERVLAFVNDNLPLIDSVFGRIEAGIAAIASGGSLASVLQVVGLNETTVGQIVRVVEVIERLAPVIAIAAGAFATFVVITTVIGWISGLVAVIAPLVSALSGAIGIITTVVATLGGPLTLAIVAIVATVGAFALAWNQNWGGIRERTAAVIENVRTLIGGLVDFFAAVVNGDFAAAFAALGQLWTAQQELIFSFQATVITFISELVIRVLEWFGVLDEETAQRFRDIVAGVIDRLGNLRTEAVAIATSIVNRIVTAFTGAISRVRAVFDRIVATVRAAFEIDWSAIGVAIIQGIVAGIASAAGSLFDAAVGAVSGAFDAAANAIGFNSPARKFIPLGEGIPEGIEVGIDSGAQRVVTAMSDLLGGTIGAFDVPPLRFSAELDSIKSLEIDAPDLTLEVPSLPTLEIGDAPDVGTVAADAISGAGGQISVTIESGGIVLQVDRDEFADEGDLINYVVGLVGAES